MSFIAVGVGAGLLVGGTAMSANAAKKKKQGMNAIANTPGLDLASMISESSGLAPQTQRLESERNVFNQQQMQAMLAAGIPGFAEMQKQRGGNALSLLRGELPPDIAQLVARRGAAKSLAGGYGGSQAASNLTARDLGRTSLDMMQLGSREAQGVISGTPMPQLANFMFTPGDIAGLRSSERTQKLNMQMSAMGMPGPGEIWGKQMQQTGGGMLSMGVGNLGGAPSTTPVSMPSYTPMNTGSSGGYYPGGISPYGG